MKVQFPLPTTVVSSLLLWTLGTACQVNHAALAPDKGASSLKIAGGEPVSLSTYPAVVEFKSGTITAWDQFCTGVFIAPQVLLTAAHCVWRQKGGSHGGTARDFDGDEDLQDALDARRKRPSPFKDEQSEAAQNPGVKAIEFTHNSKAFRSSCYAIPAGYGTEAGAPGSLFDVALVFWPEEDTAPATMDYVTTTSGEPTPSAVLTMLGYGWNQKSFEDSHLLRIGTNRLARTHEGVFETYFVHGDSPEAEHKQMVRDGDSGGPLLFNNKVVGVASALLYTVQREICPANSESEANGVLSPCPMKTVDVGYHVSLYHPKVAAFVSQTMDLWTKGQINPGTGEGCTPRSRSQYLSWLRARGTSAP